MKPFLKTSRSAALVFAAILLGGCSTFKQPYTAINYEPQAGVTPIAGAGQVTVRVEMIDSRSTRYKVSDYEIPYWSNAVGILTTNDFADVLKSAIETELTDRGFSLAGSNVVVVVELTRFYNVFKGGFWKATALAQLNMQVQVKRADGTIPFARLIAGEGVYKYMHNNKRAANIALHAAFQDAMTKLFSDGAFADAILKAGGS